MRAVALLAVIAACTLRSSPPSSDGGDDGTCIQVCCNRLVPSVIQACFQERVDAVSPPGECRWLECDRSALRFVACAQGETNGVPP